MGTIRRAVIALTAAASLGLGCGTENSEDDPMSQGGSGPLPGGSGGAAAAPGGAATTGGSTGTGGGTVSGTGGAATGGVVGQAGAGAPSEGTGGAPADTGATGGAGSTPTGTGGAAGVAGGRGGSQVSGGAGAGGVAAGGTGPAPGSVPVDPSKKITVWMVGDSTMQNCSGGGQCGWAAEFQQYLGPNATVSNQARGGRSIQTWIWGDPNVSKSATDADGECQVINNKTYSDNLATMLDATRGMKAGDWVYVAFGINDGSAGCNRHVGKALFQSDLAFLATQIRSKGANPIFGTSTSGQSCSGSMNMANRGFGPETKAAGMANNVPVIDLTQLSAALYNTLQLCPGGSATFWADGTHFKTEGATKVAGVVAQALKDQNIGLAAYLK